MFFSNNVEFQNLKTFLSSFELSRDARGIGDDASLMNMGNELWAISSDVSVEGVHHSFGWSSLEQALSKSIISNLSDIHAMGGRCCHLFFNLGANKNWVQNDFDILGKTLKKMSLKYNFSLEGGDFTRVKQASFFSFTAMGKIENSPLLRSNAKQKQKIYLTGKLGESVTGLDYLKNNLTQNKFSNVSNEIKKCIQTHLNPSPNFKIGIALSRLSKDVAAIDLSDGLSSELWHLAESSKVKLVVDQKKLPVDDTLLSMHQNLDFALHGGEEYCLLFTANLTVEEFKTLNQVTTCFCIGEVLQGQGVFLKNKEIVEPLLSQGWGS